MVPTFLLWLLRGYKAIISPLLPTACRYSPTCSEYAQEAVACHGAVYGGLKAAWRLLRCNPFSAGGYDPVILPQRPAGTPACRPDAAEVTTEFNDPVLAGEAPAANLSSNYLRLNHFWRC